MPIWSVPVSSGPLNAVCSLPGSKSESNRALVLAALADAPSKLTGLLAARDTDLMAAALRQLGVVITDLPAAADGSPVAQVCPPVRFTPAPAGIDCGLAGTVMRFVPPLAALAPGRTRFVGDPHASERPMGPLLDGLAQLGATIEGDRLPFTVDAPARLPGRTVVIDSSGSSQFISALLLAAARFPAGIELRHSGASLPSLPHIQMTVAMLRDRGVLVDDGTPGFWQVAPGAIAARNQRIEPDLTNAAVFLAAGVLSGGSVAVLGWPELTTQPGEHIRAVLAAMGAITQRVAGRLVARGCGGLRGAPIDLHQASELTPVVAALGVFAEGTTTISGVAHIRGHETDRLAAIEAELSSLGVAVSQTDDGLSIQGTGAAGTGLRPTRVLRSYADHRLAHMAALIGLVIPGVEIDDIAAVSKTMPDFTDRWLAMVTHTAKTQL